MGYVLIVTIKLATTGGVVVVVRQESGSGLESSLLSWALPLGAYFPITLYLINIKLPVPVNCVLLLLLFYYLYH